MAKAKTQCTSLLIMLAAAGWAPLAFSAPPPDRNHAPERPEEPAVAPQGNPDLDAQIAHLRAIREQLSRTDAPEERDMLIAERTKVMQDAVATVRKTSGMPSRDGMRPPSGTGKGTAQASMCHEQTRQQVALMQEMMQAMKDGQGMSAGMGRAMGGASMMGK